MGDEMKQAETGMPSLTLEPELVMEQEKEPEVQAQLMEVTQEMNPVQQKMALSLRRKNSRWSKILQERSIWKI